MMNLAVPDTRPRGLLSLLSRHSGLQLLLLAALALVVRVVAVGYMNTLYTYNYNLVPPDAQVWYVPFARSILRGTPFRLDNGTSITEVNIAPFFSIYLAGIFALFGESQLIVGLFNALLGAITCVVLTLIGREVFPRRVALIAGLILAVYPFHIFWTGYVLRETLAILLFSLSTWFTVRTLTRGGLGSAAGAGALLGVTILTRNALKAYLPVLALVLLLVPPPRASGVKRRVLLTSCALASALVMLVGWSTYEQGTLGSSQPLWAGLLGYIYGGNGPGLLPETSGSYEAKGLVVSSTLQSALDLQRPYYEVESELAGEALQYIVREPGQFLVHLSSKAISFWRPVWDGSSLASLLVLGGPYLVVLGLALVGLARSWMWNGRAALYAVVLFYAGAPLVAYGLVRGRVYLEPYLILFAAAALDRLVAYSSPAGQRPASGRAAHGRPGLWQHRARWPGAGSRTHAEAEQLVARK